MSQGGRLSSWQVGFACQCSGESVWVAEEPEAAWRDGEHAMNTGGGNERCPICLVTFHPLSTYVGYDWTTEGATAKVPLSKLLSLSHALSLREVCRKRRVNYQKYAVIRSSKKYQG